MAVRCAQCGEELLGAVNKCWRCGQLLESRHDADLPPVIQPPIYHPPVVIEQPTFQRPLILPAPGDLAPAEQVEQPANVDLKSLAVATSEPVVRTGSPFGRTAPGTWRHTTGREWTASTISAWVAVVVAVYGWVLLSFNPIISFVLALVALGLGIFGLWGRHRPAAIIAMLLCCPLIAVSGYYMFVEIFSQIYGYGPFDEPEYSDTWPPDPGETP